MMTENEKQKLIKDAANVFVAAGGILTLAFAIYFIVDLIKKVVLMSKFEIKYNDKRMIIEADSVEKALEQFKELKIDVKKLLRLVFQSLASTGNKVSSKLLKSVLIHVRVFRCGHFFF